MVNGTDRNSAQAPDLRSGDGHEAALVPEPLPAERTADFHNYSTKALMSEDASEASSAGIRLSGAAHVAGHAYLDTKSKQEEATRRLVHHLMMEENLRAMRRALDAYVADLEERVAVAELERDELLADIARNDDTLEALESSLAAGIAAIDRIEAGEELELDEDGALEDLALEELVRAYEIENGVSLDRQNTALLLAVLRDRVEQLRAEADGIRSEQDERRNALKHKEDEIEGLKSDLDEAEALKAELEQASRIADDAEREKRIENLIQDAPEHLLVEMAKSGAFSAEVDALLDERNVAFAENLIDDAATDALLTDLMQGDPVSPEASVVPKPFG